MKFSGCFIDSSYIRCILLHSSEYVITANILVFDFLNIYKINTRNTKSSIEKRNVDLTINIAVLCVF